MVHAAHVHAYKCLLQSLTLQKLDFLIFAQTLVMKLFGLCYVCACSMVCVGTDPLHNANTPPQNVHLPLPSFGSQVQLLMPCGWFGFGWLCIKQYGSHKLGISFANITNNG